MPVSFAQICAAMGLLDKLDGIQLSKLSGVPYPTIKNLLDKGKFHSVKTITKQPVIEALENAGVEFIEHDGVRRKPKTTVITLEGKEGFNKFMQDVRTHASSNDVDICVSGVDEKLFDKWHNDSPEHVGIMSKLHDAVGFSFRILVQEGDAYHSASGYAQYREVPARDFEPVSVYVYGNKKAEIIFDPDNVTIIVTQSQRLADAYRASFNSLWRNLADD